MGVDEQIGEPAGVAESATGALLEGSVRDEPTSKVMDAAILVALGVLVVLFTLVAWEALDLFAWPDAALIVVFVVFLGFVPAAFAVGAVFRWHVLGGGRSIAGLSLGVLVAGVVLLVVFGSGLVPRVRFAVSVGAMDAVAESLIAQHEGASTTVDRPGPIDIGWLTMRSYRVVSCGPYDPNDSGAVPANDPGVLFEDGFERRLLYCRHHSTSELEAPSDVETSRETDITHLGGNWYVVTEGF